MNYTTDGGVISSKVPIGPRNSRAHVQMYGVFKGTIIRVLYPNDTENNSGERVEYVVRVNGQDYPNAINMRNGGGLYNFEERIRKESDNKTSNAVFNEVLSGEQVYVMFVDGHGDYPLIVGALQHPRQYKKFQRSDGLFQIQEFNGVQISIDDSGNLKLSIVGKHDNNGTITNSSAVGTAVELRADGTVAITAKESTVVVDDNGVTINSHSAVSITSTGDTNVTASGDTKVTASGDTTVTGNQITLHSSSNAINGKVVTDNLVNNDPITGLPLQGCGGVSTT